jgi:hypothetical protein
MTRPLTKKDKDGNLYTRPLKIEKAIDASMEQETAALQKRAQVADEMSPDYLPTECLVHIIREAKGGGDERRMSALLPWLLARCEAVLLKRIPDKSRANAAEIREEILGEFGVLFAEDGSGRNPDELDFYECRFNRAFRLFRIDFLRSESARTGPLESFPAQDEMGLSPDDEERVSLLPEALRSGPTQQQSVCHSELMNAVNALPSDERKAIILCCVLGLKEESNDPGETTASKLCGVTPRTIRNRLNKAAQKLSQFK